MKKQIVSFLSGTFIVTTLFIGCSKINSPTESIKTPSNYQESNPIGQYKELIKANASPNQILGFIRTNIRSLSKGDADIAVSGFISALTKKLEVYNYGSGFDLSLKEYKDLKDVQDSLGSSSVIDKEIKNKLFDAYTEDYKLHRLEDGYNLVANFELIKTEFSNNLTEKYADYISIMAETVNGKDTTLFEIPKDLDYITAVLIKIEDYRNKYKSNDEPKNLTQIYNDYLSTYMLGGKNSYTRNMDTNILESEVLKIYEKNQKSFSGSNLEKITTEFIKVLEKNTYKFNDDVFTYINKKVGGTK